VSEFAMTGVPVIAITNERDPVHGKRLVCLTEPEPFLSVGQWYEDFRQVTDREVQDLLQQAALRQRTVQEIGLAESSEVDS
jgi:predicted phosphoribosyltransferase